MTSKHFALGLGFAIVACWIAFGFGDAILCLLGAALFAIASGYWHGELDLAELQGRFGDRASPRRR